jgi:hypothetical protein
MSDDEFPNQLIQQQNYLETDPMKYNVDPDTYDDVVAGNFKYDTKKKVYNGEDGEDNNSFFLNQKIQKKVINNDCIVGALDIKDMYNQFKQNNPNIKINMAEWAQNDKYICKDSQKFIPDKDKTRIILCDEMKKIALTCRNQSYMEQQSNKNMAAAAAEAAAEKILKDKIIKELILINAWAAVSTNNILDTNKITDAKLATIAKELHDPTIHTFDATTNSYIIPDKQFDKLIQKIKLASDIVTPDDIKRHQNERSDFKAKNNTFTSASMSKTWKNMPKMPWSRGGRKARKRRKTKKGRKGRRTRKTKKGRKGRRTNKR